MTFLRKSINKGKIEKQKMKVKVIKRKEMTENKKTAKEKNYI